jgi:phosphomannomutase
VTRIGSLKISISGVRGIVGETLTPQLLTAFAGAMVTYVGRGPILVGRDTRRSGEMVRNAVFAGLLAAGSEPVDLGICPVPSIQIRTAAVSARGAIAITASHNPVEWNALKFIGPRGLFLNSHQAEELLDIYHQRSFTLVPSAEIRGVRTDDRAIPDHLEKLERFFDVAAVRRARLKVVLDSCNGAGSLAAPRFLRDLGCRVVELHTSPDGDFPRNPEPTPRNLTVLRRTVVRHRADVGFAQDADADRLAVIDARGRPIGEDYTLALATLFVLRRRKGPVVVNLGTTRAIDDIAASLGCPVIHTRIGEINVVEEMIQSGASVGGEGNGGVIVPEVHYCRDSMTGMGAVLQLMAEEGSGLAEIVRKLPRYSMVKEKIELPMDRFAELEEALSRRFSDAKRIRTDGLKLLWDDAWLLVRASNTEPIVRIVSEGRAAARARSLAAEATRIAARIVSGRRGRQSGM